MLDATFIRKSARHLTEARRIRLDLPKLKGQLAAYVHVSPMDKAREVDRMTLRHNTHVAMARYFNEQARIYTQGDDLLRMAERQAQFGETSLSAWTRDLAHRTFERAESLPLPL